MSQISGMRKHKTVRMIPSLEQGAWINYQCKRRQVKHEEIARSAGVSRQMVQQVIYGKRTSARIQKQIATSLGYDSWMELLAARKGVAA